jgi:hypothetical protein
MHTEGVDEVESEDGFLAWFVRTECRACRWMVGIELPPDHAGSLVDRLLWSDDARDLLSRMPPYVASLLQPEVEEYVRGKGQRVVTLQLFNEARRGGAIGWEPEAERRLMNVPAPVRAMARAELERTAAEEGLSQVSVALMERVKARYFGLAAQ